MPQTIAISEIEIMQFTRVLTEELSRKGSFYMREVQWLAWRRRHECIKIRHANTCEQSDRHIENAILNLIMMNEIVIDPENLSRLKATHLLGRTA